MSRAVHLVRHGHHPMIGQVLCGRTGVVGLDEEGVRQMSNVGKLFRGRTLACLQCSPQRRARQSAEIVAHALSLEIEEVAAADELDFGSWSGLLFDTLKGDPHWRQWNERRASARPPGGESMCELQQRLTAHIEQIARSDKTGDVLIVSHAEPIRAVVLGYLGLSLERYAEIAIDPASISTIELDGAHKGGVVCINRRCDP